MFEQSELWAWQQFSGIRNQTIVRLQGLNFPVSNLSPWESHNDAVRLYAHAVNGQRRPGSKMLLFIIAENNVFIALLT